MANEQDRQRCLDQLVWATQQLNPDVKLEQLTKTADLIVQTMTGPWRYFHTPDHIFEVGGEDDPIEMLAALFHDLVYVQVDQSLGINLSWYISPFIKETAGQLYIRDTNELPKDEIFDLVTAIFGFSPGQLLSPLAGQNEFLSALVSAKTLDSLLPRRYLAEITACIEATIPFRPKLHSGVTVGEALHDRLEEANSRFQLGMTATEIRDAAQRSIRLANRDVGNFAHPDSAYFLSNTWNLMPETNHNLKNSNSYTVYEYRIALQKMEGFLSFLKPELVFHKFHNEPTEQEYQEMVERTRHNLEVSRLYLGTKLVSIAVLEALSTHLGRDVPISTMMGELPTSGVASMGLEQLLPKVPQPCLPKTDLEAEVLNLLEHGLARSTSYDLKNSPLATFIAKSLGFAEVRRLLVKAREFFQGVITAENFLAECSPALVRVVTEVILKIFENRKAVLNRLMDLQSVA